ncbi:MAG: SIS domain-containing protein [Clostridia bacterium]
MDNTNFTQYVLNLINDIDKYESDNIAKAGKLIYNAMRNKGLLHIFCTGHSHMMAEEMFYRAGGLVQVNPILEPMLMQHEGAVRSTKLERLPGLANLIFNSVDVRVGEPFMVVSNSGINAVPIEMAMCAREKGCPIIIVTSKKVSEKLTSRHSSGKRLFELADVLIDNHTPDGDGAIVTEGNNQIGAVSTIACSYIAQRLVIEIVASYEADGLEPAIYKSANTLGGDEHNKDIFQEYQKRIRSLY